MVREARLPNLIVLGAQKAATRSLHYYPGLHPEARLIYVLRDPIERIVSHYTQSPQRPSSTGTG